MRVAVGCVVAGLLAILLSAFGPKAQFTVDGYDYAIMMLVDRGVPDAQAERHAAAFFATQPIAKNPLYAPWLHGKPEYWELFSVRRLDPWLASLLYPWRGFAALIDVSRASYVAVAVLAVLLAARFAGVTLAVGAGAAISLFPAWRDIARDSLTDPLAIALTAATLLAAVACMRRRSIWRLAVFAVLCGALVFTRPIGYIIAGAAAIAAIAAVRCNDRDTKITVGWIAAISALWTLASVVALERAHAPSFGWIVADTYDHMLARGYAPPGEPLARWYVAEELAILRHALRDATLAVLPLLAVVGVALRRADRATPLLAGACVATWLGAIVDPSTQDMLRCVVMPIAPVVAAFAAATIRDAVTLVPVLLGPQAQPLRLNLPGRSRLRKDTVKE